MTGTRRGNRESWIRETPNDRGYYEARVWMGTTADGKPDRRHVERKTLRAVRAKVRELERQRDAGLAGKARRPRTVREMLTRHLDVVLPQRGRAPKTIASYRSLCEHQIFPRWGGQRIDRLLPEYIEDGYAEMLAGGLSASTGASSWTKPTSTARSVSVPRTSAHGCCYAGRGSRILAAQPCACLQSTWLSTWSAPT